MPPYLYYPLVGIVFVLMISILVAAHELGHYLFARLFNMGVEEFAIGFGKRPLFTWMRKTYRVDPPDPHVETPSGESAAEGAPAPTTETTDFTVRPWPLGGFVRIKGMLPEDDGSEVKIPGGFYSKPPWQRLLVLLAGPAFSVIAGILILVPIYMMAGVERAVKEPVLGTVYAEGPAAAAGLKAGDKVISVNGEPVRVFHDVLRIVRGNGGKSIPLVYERAGESREVKVTPSLDEKPTPILDEDMQPTADLAVQGKLMVLPRTEVVRLSFAEATAEAAEWPVKIVKNLAGLVMKPSNFERTVSGPASMVQFTGLAINEGLDKVLLLAALLSISVGIFNLLPVPPLDGGQMVVAFAEMLRGGRRLSMQVQTALSGVGLVLVMCLMLGAIFVDIKRFVNRPEPKEKPAATKAK